ncbi:MAG: hypothetical protein LAO79_25575, partial [Acidobacteriia bacterium]|nr:hypothetical protein [Terriglobia bacterium]
MIFIISAPSGSGKSTLTRGLLQRMPRLRFSVSCLLDYQTSGEITGDYGQSVSYAALGYYRREDFDLGAADREALLDSASETLRLLRETGQREAVPARGGSTALETRRGA